MTTHEVATRFIHLEREGKWEQIQDELYADDCESIEPKKGEEIGMFSVKGKKAIRAKGKAFNDTIEEAHNGYCSKPIVGGSYFSVAMGLELTLKKHGRVKIEEIAVFTVKEGKIIAEQFFY